jgi:beta-glucosidase
MTAPEIGTALTAVSADGRAPGEGRGQGVWDAFAGRPGAIADATRPARGAGHLERLHADVALIRELGARCHRFDVAWARVQPEGRGRPDPAGLDLYDRMVDRLGEAGIVPWPVLLHRDWPQAVQARGGWGARDTVWRFAEYACAVMARIGDRIGDVTIVADPVTLAVEGHATGRDAPGITDPAAFGAALHHLTLAQAVAGSALRQENGRWRLVAGRSLRPMRPGDDSMAADEARLAADALWRDALPMAWAEGRYPDSVADALDLPMADGDADRLRFAFDGFMLDYAGPGWARRDAASSLAVAIDRVPPGRRAETLDATGQAQDEAILEEALGAVDRGKPLALVLGAAFDERLMPDGSIADPARIAYLDSHLAAVGAACAAGCPVGALFVRELLDGFEGRSGLAARAGLVQIDPASGARRPKQSYRWLQARVGL